MLWNARDEEQQLIAGTNFAGSLPESNNPTNVLGVYLNDATGAKMDYYLTAGVRERVSRCETGTTLYRTAVTLTSTAPTDAATSLPAYVTGIGTYGVEPGVIRTRMIVYGPVGATLSDVLVDGRPSEAQSERHLGRPVAQLIIDLDPGQESTVLVEMTSDEEMAGRTEVRVTPLVESAGVNIHSLDCG